MKMKQIHYISYFHTNILYIKLSRIPEKENNYIKITYQLMRRQQTYYKIIHQEEYIQVYLIISLNICESNRI